MGQQARFLQDFQPNPIGIFKQALNGDFYNIQAFTLFKLNKSKLWVSVTKLLLLICFPPVSAYRSFLSNYECLTTINMKQRRQIIYMKFQSKKLHSWCSMSLQACIDALCVCFARVMNYKCLSYLPKTAYESSLYNKAWNFCIYSKPVLEIEK